MNTLTKTHISNEIIIPNSSKSSFRYLHHSQYLRNSVSFVAGAFKLYEMILFIKTEQYE